MSRSLEQMEINLQIQVEFNLDIIRKIQVVTFMWNLKGNPIIEERMYNFQISKIRQLKQTNIKF